MAASYSSSKRKERVYLGKSENKIRYSLIVSLSTPATNVDLYTPIVNQIGTITETLETIELAKKIDGKIVSADSMQIYKDMNIGTAKPDINEMQGIEHYLLDFVNLISVMSVLAILKLLNLIDLYQIL